MSYKAAWKRVGPNNKIVDALQEMRRDTVDLVKKAIGDKRWVPCDYYQSVRRKCPADDLGPCAFPATRLHTYLLTILKKKLSFQ